MPRELSPAEERAFARYEALGTPEELQKAVSEVERLKTENATRRQENKTLTEERDAAKALVPEGARVLTGDDAKAYADLEAKGVKITDVAKITEERDTLRDRDAKRTRRDGLAKAGATEGYVPESVPVLDKLLGDLPLEVRDEDVDVTENGKTTRQKKPVGYVTTADGKQVRLSAWAEAEGYPAALFTATGKPGGSTTDMRPAPAQRGNGTAAPTEKTPEDHKKAVSARVDYSV